MIRNNFQNSRICTKYKTRRSSEEPFKILYFSSFPNVCPMTMPLLNQIASKLQLYCLPRKAAKKFGILAKMWTQVICLLCRTWFCKTRPCRQRNQGSGPNAFGYILNSRSTLTLQVWNNNEGWTDQQPYCFSDLGYTVNLLKKEIFIR